MVGIEDVRALTLTLPRTTEHLIRDRVRFRIGRIVYLAFSRDETLMGFAFPKEEREALVAAEPTKFLLPAASDLRYSTFWNCLMETAINTAPIPATSPSCSQVGTTQSPHKIGGVRRARTSGVTSRWLKTAVRIGCTA